MDGDGPLGRQYWREFRNDSGEEIPPFACMRITGSVTVSTGFLVLTVGKPNTFGAQYNHVFNGPLKVASGKYGICTRDDGAAAVYDSADGTPAFGEAWGPRSGTWKLKKNTGGFSILQVSNTVDAIAVVSPCPFLRFKGTTTIAHNVDTSQDVNIYSGTGAGSDTGVDMPSVFNEFASMAISKPVECVWEGDVAGVKWRLVSGRCVA